MAAGVVVGDLKLYVGLYVVSIKTSGMFAIGVWRVVGFVGSRSWVVGA